MNKKPKTKPVATVTEAGKFTSYPASLSSQDVNAKWAETMGKPKNDGRNGYVAEFLVLARRVFDTNGRSFDFSDFVNANKVFEIPIEELDRLFKRYVEALQSWRVVEEIHGAYDFPCYVRLV